MSARPPKTGSQSGLTMLEVVCTTVVALVFMGITFQTMRVTTEATHSTISSSELDLRVHRVVQRLARELTRARVESIVPMPEAPLGASSLTFKIAELDETGSPAWSTLRRIELVPSPTDPRDGLDNDSDGLVDEHEIWIVEDVGLVTERRTVLCRRVADSLEGETGNSIDDNDNGLIDERGLSISMLDDILSIRVSLQSSDGNGGVLTRTAETALLPRN